MRGKKIEIYHGCMKWSECLKKALYLYSVHAGLHLQLLHSFPGMGDAGGAVVGDTVLHDASVTPDKGTKGGRVGGGGLHIESMNTTLNPEDRSPPGATSLAPLQQPFSATNPFITIIIIIIFLFKFKEPILSRESVFFFFFFILSGERASEGSSWTQSVFMHD